MNAPIMERLTEVRWNGSVMEPRNRDGEEAAEVIRELLEALQALLNGVTQHGMMADHGSALRAKARAAIAKATGAA